MVTQTHAHVGIIIRYAIRLHPAMRLEHWYYSWAASDFEQNIPQQYDNVDLVL